MNKLYALNSCIEKGCLIVQISQNQTTSKLSKSKYISITLEACSLKEAIIGLTLAAPVELLTPLSWCLTKQPWLMLKREPQEFRQEILKQELIVVLILNFDPFG